MSLNRSAMTRRALVESPAVARVAGARDSSAVLAVAPAKRSNPARFSLAFLTLVIVLTGAHAFTPGAAAQEPLPDLIALTKFSTSAVLPGATVPVTVTTTNKAKNGAGAVPSITRIYLSADETVDAADILLTSLTIPALASRGVNTMQTTVTIPAGLVGTYRMLTVADAGNTNVESDETNNVAVAGPFTFLPDLVVSRLTAPNKALAGATISVSDTTGNRGTSQAPPSTTSYHLSRNTTLDASDVFLGTRAVPPLGLGAESVGTMDLVIPANTPPGCYFIIASADLGNAIAESQEDKNALARRIRIPPASGVNLSCAPSDFNGDSKTDILWRHASGLVDIWLMNGPAIASANTRQYTVDLGWTVQGVGDFNGDGDADILWRHTSGLVSIWLMDGPNTANPSPQQYMIDPAWTIQAVGDLNGDGKADILWRESHSGAVGIWLMDGATISSAAIPLSPSLDWVIQAVGDLNGDGKADILWRQSRSGVVGIWIMDGITLVSSAVVLTTALDWVIQGVGDFNGDGKADILWRNTSSGEVGIWLMNGTII